MPPWQPIAGILAVNTLAPYILTALVERPDRLVYISSSEHHAGEGPLRGIDWTSRRWDSARVYGESKLYVTALAFAVARRWPEVLSNAVDPGWARTRMEGRALRSTSRPDRMAVFPWTHPPPATSP